jgi:adenylate cyclase
VFDSKSDTLGPNDKALAEAIARYPNVVIGKKQQALTASATRLPFAPFRREGQMGYVDMVPDQDSFIRRVRVAQPPGGSEQMDAFNSDDFYLGLKAVSLYLGVEEARYVRARNEIQMGDMRIPVDVDRAMLIKYATTPHFLHQVDSPYAFRTYPYFQVWEDAPSGIEALISGGHLRDKIVLVGETYVESHDSYPTPFSAGAKLFSKEEHFMPGVEIHANVINTVLNREFLRHQSTFGQYALIVLCALLISLMAIRARLIWGVPMVFLAMVGYAAVGACALIYGDLWMPIVAPCAAILLGYMGTTTLRVVIEQREKLFIRKHFSHYVPRSVVQELLQNPQMAQLGGTERELTALFSDVQGFTRISQRLGPAELRALLDEYLTQMTDCVIKHGGIIDKYEGDAIMAEFGAPIYLEDHAHRACLAALEMQDRLATLRAKFIEQGRPIIRARIGIASGLVVLGNMGSSGIPGSSDPVFDYTAIGDCIILASRLESANKQYGTYVMISEDSQRKLPHEMVTRELDAIVVVGRTGAVRVYEVIARDRSELSEDRKELLAAHHRGLAAYRAQEWDGAIRHFRTVLGIDANDGPAEVYIGRCAAFKVNPPGLGWDGSFRLTEK